MWSKSYFTSRYFKMTAKKNPVKHWAFLHMSDQLDLSKTKFGKELLLLFRGHRVKEGLDTFGGRLASTSGTDTIEDGSYNVRGRGKCLGTTLNRTMRYTSQLAEVIHRELCLFQEFLDTLGSFRLDAFLEVVAEVIGKANAGLGFFFVFNSHNRLLWHNVPVDFEGKSELSFQ